MLFIFRCKKRIVISFRYDLEENIKKSVLRGKNLYLRTLMFGKGRKMADNIVLKTYKGGNVTPQDDAIIYEAAIPGRGIFKGCEVTYARGNVLHISQGFGMVRRRFFEAYETEIDVRLADVNINYNNSSYDLELTIFTVSSAGLDGLTKVFPTLKAGSGGGGGFGGNYGLRGESGASGSG